MNSYILLALLAGTLLPIQAGVNTALKTQLGEPMIASLASFTVGAISLAIYCLAARLPVPTTPLDSIPLWQWAGGILGAVYLSLVILLVPKLGSAISFGLIITGQLLASLVLDHFGLLGNPQHPINPMRLVGLVFMIAGVVLVRKF